MQRVPIAGLTTLNGIDSAVKWAEGSVKQRAIAYVPNDFDPGTAIEILVHLHGRDDDSRVRFAGSKASPGTVHDVASDKIAAQVTASGRRMIVLLPQGTAVCAFGPTGMSDFDIGKFIDEALAALVTAGVLSAKPDVGPVILSAHSGGGGELSVLFSQKGTPHIPATVEAEFLFEAINGSTEVAMHAAFITGKLNAALAAIKAAADDAARSAYLATSFRFAGFYNSGIYVTTYPQLRQLVDAWFAHNAGALGGAKSPAYTTLRAQYVIYNPPFVPHEEQVDRDNLLTALRMLP
jgi:hypothetical protein